MRLPAHGPSSPAPAPATANTSPFGPPVWKRSSRIVRRVNAASKAEGENEEEKKRKREEISANENRKREAAAPSLQAALLRVLMPPSY